MSKTRNKVLIVDDDFISLEVLKAMVGHYPVDIITAQTGQEAINLVVDEQPTLILLDHELPDIDGIDVYCRLTDKLGKNVPTTVMVTGHQHADFSARCAAAGINQQLQKPVQPQQLAELLRIASGIE